MTTPEERRAAEHERYLSGQALLWFLILAGIVVGLVIYWAQHACDYGC
jgi:hypothetical protein